jgi:hypothetical protein
LFPGSSSCGTPVIPSTEDDFPAHGEELDVLPTLDVALQFQPLDFEYDPRWFTGFTLPGSAPSTPVANSPRPEANLSCPDALPAGSLQSLVPSIPVLPVMLSPAPASSMLTEAQPDVSLHSPVPSLQDQNANNAKTPCATNWRDLLPAPNPAAKNAVWLTRPVSVPTEAITTPPQSLLELATLLSLLDRPLFYLGCCPQARMLLPLSLHPRCCIANRCRWRGQQTGTMFIMHAIHEYKLNS